MKQTLTSLFALFALATAPMWAAKRIQMESADLVKNTTKAREILVDVDRMRVNDGDTSVMFLTKGGNRLVMLDKAKNEYREMDQAAMDAMGQQMAGVMAQMDQALKGMDPAQRAMMEQMMKGKMPGAAAAAAPVVSTAYTAKGAGTVNGFRCTNYDGMKGAQKVSEICAAQMADAKLSASDFQVMEKMREFLSGMLNAMQNSPMAGLMPSSSITQAGINGFPVQTTNFTNGQATTREQVKAVVDATFTDADFSTGAAQKVEMPAMGAAAAKGKAKGK